MAKATVGMCLPGDDTARLIGVFEGLKKGSPRPWA